MSASSKFPSILQVGLLCPLTQILAFNLSLCEYAMFSSNGLSDEEGPCDIPRTDLAHKDHVTPPKYGDLSPLVKTDFSPGILLILVPNVCAH